MKRQPLKEILESFYPDVCLFLGCCILPHILFPKSNPHTPDKEGNFVKKNWIEMLSKKEWFHAK